MTSDIETLLTSLAQKLLKAIQHLEYSFKKIEQLSPEVETLSLEKLEHWESFSARFGRSADLFLSKYLRTYIQYHEPGFRGSFRDLVNVAEKLGVIEDANIWAEIKQLRNISAHEYEEEKLSEHFKKMRDYAPFILKIKEILKT